MSVKLNVVLFEPEIAGNVGSIMRTCIATDVKLHLIQPFGFFLDDRFIRRSSVNYVEDVKHEIYDDWADFQQKHPQALIFYTTGHTNKLYTSVDYTKLSGDVYIVFGRESTGINSSILAANSQQCLRVPMAPGIRSLNLANTVALIVYDALKQINFPNLK